LTTAIDIFFLFMPLSVDDRYFSSPLFSFSLMASALATLSSPLSFSPALTFIFAA
jgi:hypothetical protein